MSNADSPTPNANAAAAIVAILSSYGPKATQGLFGVIVLVVLHQTIIVPQLKRYEINFTEHQEILKLEREIVGELKQSVVLFNATSQRFESAVERICNVVQNRQPLPQ